MLEPGPALLRQKVRENWTEKHRNVAKKIFLEGGWTPKKLLDTGWSDISQCQACQMEEGKWHAVRRDIPAVFRTWEQKAKTSKKEWKWQRGVVEIPLGGSQWNRGNSRMKMGESENHRSWGLQVEGFRGHVETDSSL